MALLCSIGFHSWDGCKCSTCGKTRDEGHDLSEDCETCAKCGKNSGGKHDWGPGDKCARCGKPQIVIVWQEYIDRAGKCIENKMFQKAIEQLTEAEKISGQHDIISFLRTQAFLGKGDSEQAANEVRLIKSELEADVIARLKVYIGDVLANEAVENVNRHVQAVNHTPPGGCSESPRGVAMRRLYASKREAAKKIELALELNPGNERLEKLLGQCR